MVSSTGALSLEEVPDRMVVIGAGVIGLELVSQRREVVVREVGRGEKKRREQGRKGEDSWERKTGGREREGQSVEEEKEKKDVTFGMIFLL